MKLHYCGFLSFCLLLSALLLSSPLRAAFEIDIHINGAANPSLTFGEVDQGDATRSPFPPYSGMFGVADVCFAGAAGAEQWFDRLGEDIKVAADNNTWILVAKSNARLTFSLQEGDMPDGLYIVYNNVKTGEPATPVQLSDGASFSVKTGGVYTITRNSDADPEDNPQGASSQFVPKDGIGEADFEPKDDEGNSFTLKKIKISFVSGRGVVAYVGENLAERVPPITEAEVDWWFSASREGYEVAYNWTIPYTELEITLTPVPGGRGTRADDLKVSMDPTRSAAPPNTTTLDFLDELGAKRLTKVIDWILQKFGTLDFDGDGEVTMDDAIYLYNFVSGDCDPDTAAEDLMSYASKYATVEKAQAALDYFRANISELYFDGTDETNGILLDNAVYVYNFVSGSLDPDATAADLMSYASKYATENLAEAALDNMRDMLE
ncbi:MAG: hypothetical protein GX902_00265 [Lentisphaerae bacterium]|nr:hypothetical protein [Lentisphaerota bacterium]